MNEKPGCRFNLASRLGDDKHSSRTSQGNDSGKCQHLVWKSGCSSAGSEARITNDVEAYGNETVALNDHLWNQGLHSRSLT